MLCKTKKFDEFSWCKKKKLRQYDHCLQVLKEGKDFH